MDPFGEGLEREKRRREEEQQKRAKEKTVLKEKLATFDTIIQPKLKRYGISCKFDENYGYLVIGGDLRVSFAEPNKYYVSIIDDRVTDQMLGLRDQDGSVETAQRILGLYAFHCTERDRRHKELIAAQKANEKRKDREGTILSIIGLATISIVIWCFFLLLKFMAEY